MLDRQCQIANVSDRSTPAAHHGNTGDDAREHQERSSVKSGLNVAYEQLDFAKAKGFSGTVDWTKAASLLSAASIQQEFGKYPNCVDKVRRARYYIEQSQK